MKNKKVDIICLIIVAVLFGTVTVMNIAQPERPTTSESERRELAKMPEFSFDSLTDGSYFKGIAAFISDTFIFRDKLVDTSKKLDTLKGFDYSVDGNDSFALLGPTGGNETGDDSDLAGKLSDAIDNLKNKQTETSVTETETDSKGSQSVTGEIVDHDQTDESETSVEEKSTETDAVDETVPEESAETDTPTDENAVVAINLSKTTVRLTVGSGAVVYATVETTNEEGAVVSWSISDKNVAQISINESGGINVKGLKVGEAVLTCSWKNKIKETCKINVTEISSDTHQQDDGHADFLASGLFIYGDAVYTQAWYNDSASQVYAQTVGYYKKLFGDDVRVSCVIAPVSSMVVDNEEVQSKIQNQDEMIQKIGAHMDPSVNFVNPYSEMYDHKDEYLFFKSDHHWTQRGAYYAYVAFANSVGLEPVALDKFDYEIRNDNYHGSLYSWTKDERVKNFTDTIEVFNPTKKLTMTVSSSNGATYNYDTAIVKTNNTYVTYIAGDNPYTVINVPDNPQDKNILVLKDSFGNAFVPFLCEHYGNIIVLDVRYSSMNIYEQLKDYGLTDIVFVNNAQAVTSQWAQMYMKAVGIE